MKLFALFLLFACAICTFAADTRTAQAPSSSNGPKLIALTFDDGPRPYVLYGNNSPGLIDLLERTRVKATFFVMGWRLTPGTWGERREFNIGKTCIDAARDLHRRGHEIENHTYSHVEMSLGQRQHGEAWVLNDIAKGSSAIKSAVGVAPRYLRPPKWVLPDGIRPKIGAQGLRVLTIAATDPLPVRDVNSADYLCAGKAVQCPRPSLNAFVLQQIEQREKKGVTTHVLAFHELSTTVSALESLIPELQKRGYRFVSLDEYMKAVSTKD